MIALAKLPKAEPNRDLCKALRELLAQAEAGEVRSVVGLQVYRNDDTQVFWSTEYGVHPVLILGALRMAMRDFEDRIIEKRGPD